MSEWEVTLTGVEAGPATEARHDALLSFEEAFESHHGVVYRYAYALTRDGALAEDVVQEVFLRLHRGLDSAQRAGMVRAWLLRVTANIARNILRTRRRAAVRDESFGVEMLSNHDEPLQDAAMVRDAELARARQALRKLKEPLRSCLLLRHEGLSYREIAVALGLRESSVGSLIARGRNEFVNLYRKVGKER